MTKYYMRTVLKELLIEHESEHLKPFVSFRSYQNHFHLRQQPASVQRSNGAMFIILIGGFVSHYNADF